MTTFNNRTAVITGAGIGIGFAIAQSLAERGANLILNDLDAGLARAAADRIHELGGKCIPVAGDSSDLGCIDEMIRRGAAEFGRIDIAVANAGITTFGSFLDYSLENFQQLSRVNLQGTFFLAQRAARQMIAQGTGGRIALMSSATGIQFHPDLTAYGMSKAAIMHLAKMLGVELAGHGITVNAISPGATLTERTIQLEEGKFKEEWDRTTPTGKCATTGDVAHAALFLLSDQAGQITGQTIVVDGGWTSLSPPPH